MTDNRSGPVASVEKAMRVIEPGTRVMVISSTHIDYRCLGMVDNVVTRFDPKRGYVEKFRVVFDNGESSFIERHDLHQVSTCPACQEDDVVIAGRARFCQACEAERLTPC